MDMTRLFSRTKAPLVCGAFFLLVVSAAAPSFAASSATSTSPVGVIGGVSWSKGNHELIPQAHGMAFRGAKRTAAPGGSGLLTYHCCGPVMHANKTYAIYWLPSGSTMSSNYQSLVNRYFTDVAAASGATDNVYAVETQYYDQTSSNGPKTYVQYNSTFGGSTVATRAFPSNGCSIWASRSA